VTNGLMGSVPEYYPLVTAARYYGVAPWDLATQCVWWEDIAHICRSAEVQSQAEKSTHRPY